MNKPLWALAGIALLGTAGAAAALVIAPSGGEEEVVVSQEGTPAPTGTASASPMAPTSSPTTPTREEDSGSDVSPSTTATPPSSQQPSEMTIELGPISDSGVFGTATIREVDGTIEVSLMISGYGAGIHPADIRWSQPYNKCDYPNSGGVVHDLNDVSEGVSITSISGDLNSFRSRAPYVIVVYESPEQPIVPVACGVV